MRTAGLVGGTGPESTVDYYRRIIARWRARTDDDGYPSLVIRSLNLTEMIALVTAGAWDRLADMLADEVARLAAAGADFAVLTANTGHAVFDAVRARASIPMISIVEAARDEMTRLGVSRAGLFGTRFTMEGRFYPEVCRQAGIAIVIPHAEDRAFVHERYMSELVRGRFLPETHDGLLAIARRMRREQGIGALILGGTELPLVLPEKDIDGMPVLDTTAIHVERIVEAMMSAASSR